MMRALALVSFLVGIAILVVPVARLGFVIASSNPESDPHGYGLVFALMAFLPLVVLIGIGLLGLLLWWFRRTGALLVLYGGCGVLLTLAVVWFDPFGLAGAVLAGELAYVIATAYGLLIVGIERREGG
jgi:hypothetical protein